MSEIAGYTYGTTAVAPSPISLDDFEKLRATVLFGTEDEHYLRMAGEVLAGQTDAILDLWYGFVGSHPHLVQYFTDGQGNALTDYLGAVRARFGQWIADLCRRPYDQDWLNYQHEIALRHHRAKKNQTDGARSVPIIHFRYMVAFIYPITATIRQFLAAKGHSADEVDKMHQAWFKAVTLSVILWSVPYVKEGDF
ncbi:MAG: protogloblin ApPgb [Chloroflexi bacterium]|nr:protogloblin ApPgb [Ardenticatenaceae bacterium]MBL1128999.1 protogloblin ApPgb [Chloroflexota bacterium]NOG35078.1 protogloblin ApPgb [Chloroflexota bacterium]GIK59052.1 MAG: hypothetical protein BroJett015_47150 [Chloroflexota bacterium]